MITNIVFKSTCLDEQIITVGCIQTRSSVCTFVVSNPQIPQDHIVTVMEINAIANRSRM